MIGVPVIGVPVVSSPVIGVLGVIRSRRHWIPTATDGSTRKNFRVRPQPCEVSTPTKMVCSLRTNFRGPGGRPGGGGPRTGAPRNDGPRNGAPRGQTGGPRGPQPGDGPRQPWILVHAAEIDLDTDKIISRNEIVGEATKAFAGYDADDDGKLSQSELSGRGGSRSAMGGFLKGHAPGNRSRRRWRGDTNRSNRQRGAYVRQDGPQSRRQDLAGRDGSVTAKVRGSKASTRSAPLANKPPDGGDCRQ